jgi:hypothetical protein
MSTKTETIIYKSLNVCLLNRYRKKRMQNRKGKAAYDPYDLLALESGTSRTIHSVTGPAQLAAQNYKYHAGATDGGRPGKRNSPLVYSALKMTNAKMIKMRKAKDSIRVSKQRI